MTAIRELLDDTTTVYRPGDEVVSEQKGGIRVVHLWVGTPHESEAPPEARLIDVHFFRVAVDPAAAERRRADFKAVCEAWPLDPSYAPENRLAKGPSYIELGAQIGTMMGQQDAFRFMALGEVLGFWDVITPKRLLGDDLPSAQADELAGRGLVLISGYKPDGGT